MVFLSFHLLPSFSFPGGAADVENLKPWSVFANKERDGKVHNSLKFRGKVAGKARPTATLGFPVSEIPFFPFPKCLPCCKFAIQQLHEERETHHGSWPQKQGLGEFCVCVVTLFRK
uniref:Uncharacterized protein n=1 Tax=Sphaerodactylus townsendi TaxID=933632 RepID=A0ACB8FP35_9SAUR